MFPPAVLLPAESSAEIKAILMACMLKDIPVFRTNVDLMEHYALGLQAGDVLPVGSVEFMQLAFTLAGVSEPPNISYHPAIVPFLYRPIHRWRIGELRTTPLPRPIFVKPHGTKLFTGFVLRAGQSMLALDPNDSIEAMALAALSPNKSVWTSEVIHFESEWRYYVDGQGGALLGEGVRYDANGPADCVEPDADFVKTVAAAAWAALGHSFVLDVGVQKTTNKCLVVELNDAWAIGLYGQAITPVKYLEFLYGRWSSLVPMIPMVPVPAASTVQGN